MTYSYPRSPIADRLTASTLFAAHGIEVVRTGWHRQRHPANAVGFTGYAAIEFMHVGAFEKRCGRRRAFADPGTAVFFERDESFEVRHPVGEFNAGTTIRLHESALAMLEIDSRARTFDRTDARTLPRFDLALHRVLARLERAASESASDPLEVEEVVFDLVREAVRSGREGAFPSEGSAVERLRVDRMRAVLNERYTEPLRLADIAAEVRCSPWHAAKVFKKVAGTTLHRALTRLRLRHALDRIRTGADDLTRLAFELGFSSHSHFSSTFLREFGITPRQARKGFSGSRDW